MSKIPALKEKETPAEYIRRVSNWSEWQKENLLNDLPSIEALLTLHFIVTQLCDTDLIEDAFRYCRNTQEAKAFNRFIKKYKLNWRKAVIYKEGE